MKHRIRRFPHQQLESALGRFEIVALILHLLDTFQQFPPRFVAQTVGQPVLLQLVE